MSKKLLSGQRPFTMLAPALVGSTDPSRGKAGNPQYKRKTFTQQFIVERPGPTDLIEDGKSPGVAHRIGVLLTGSPPSASTGQITVVGNTFVGPTTITLGQYVLESGDDFLVGALVANTAANLAAAISALPEYSAVAVGPVISIQGPVGPVGEFLKFMAGGASPNNFALSPADGTLSGGDPHIGPPTMT